LMSLDVSCSPRIVSKVAVPVCDFAFVMVMAVVRPYAETE